MAEKKRIHLNAASASADAAAIDKTEGETEGGTGRTTGKTTEKHTEEGKKHNAHAGHREKLRRRFMTEGLEGFEPHNALELLLFYAIPQRDTNELAHRLIDRFGSLSEVFNAPCSQLMEVDGVSERTAVLIALIPQMFRMYATDLVTHKRPEGTEHLYSYLFTMLSTEPVEKILFVSLDNRGSMLSCDCIASGEVNSATMDFRRLVSICVSHGATAAILAHNHPRGRAMPSDADIECTMNVRDALSYIDVLLVDHVIVARDEMLSMASIEDLSYLFKNR